MKIRVKISIKEEYIKELLEYGELEFELENSNIPPEVLSIKCQKEAIKKFIDIKTEII